jgi:hypothetical protein
MSLHSIPSISCGARTCFSLREKSYACIVLFLMIALFVAAGGGSGSREAVSHSDLVESSAFRLDPFNGTPLAGELWVDTLADTTLTVVE